MHHKCITRNVGSRRIQMLLCRRIFKALDSRVVVNNLVDLLLGCAEFVPHVPAPGINVMQIPLQFTPDYGSMYDRLVARSRYGSTVSTRKLRLPVALPAAGSFSMGATVDRQTDRLRWGEH